MARFQNEELAVRSFLRISASPSDSGGHKWHKQAWIMFNNVSALNKPYYKARRVSDY